MTDFIEIEKVFGEGPGYLMINPEHIYVDQITIRGKYAGFDGRFEMICRDWEVSDKTLIIEP